MSVTVSPGSEPPAKPKKTARYYSSTTLKVLFGMCGNQCAKPNCTEPIIASATEFSEAAVIGQIAHIYAHADGGPRSKPDLTKEERDSYINLILLCPTHHTAVDTQHETYPAAMLIEWKEKHERQFQKKVTATITDLGYAELEVAAKALIAIPAPAQTTSLVQIPPKDKINKNDLGPEVELLLTMGAAKAYECEEVIRKAAQLDPAFPGRLRDGFVSKYNDLKSKGRKGDELFFDLLQWSTGGERPEKARGASGLCLLTHLFILCDVFEK